MESNTKLRAVDELVRKHFGNWGRQEHTASEYELHHCVQLKEGLKGTSSIIHSDKKYYRADKIPHYPAVHEVTYPEIKELEVPIDT